MRRVVILAGLVAVAGVLLWHASRFDFICDDAYISFRYAENLATYGELNWNPGAPPVEGYTNFLWTVLLAVGIKAGVGPERLAPVLELVFGVLTLFMLYWLQRVLAGAGGPDPLHPGRRLRWTREWLGGAAPLSGWDLLAPALAASWGAFACWTSGGLETPLFTFLFVLALTQYLREEVVAQEVGRGRLRTSFLWFALAAMTRPEGALFFVVVGAHRLLWTLGGVTVHGLARRPGLRRRLDNALQSDGLWAIGFLVCYGAYFAWRYEYYGWLFPNTYYVKVATTNAAQTRAGGFAYLGTFVRDYHLWRYAPALLLALAVPWLWRPIGGHPPEVLPPRSQRLGAGTKRLLFLWTLVVALLVVHGWHVVRFGGDFMAMHRFFVPMIPLLALLIGLGARALWDLPLRPLLRRLPAGVQFWSFVPLSALLIGAFASTSTTLDRRTLTTLRVTPTGYSGAYDQMESVAFMRKFANDRVLVGRWLHQRVPRWALMAVGGAGAIVYYSKLRALDSFGLSDLWTAHYAKAVSHRPGHQKRTPLQRVLRRRPDIICYPGIVRLQNWEYRPPPHERRRWDRRGYRYFCATPRGLYPSHYCCLFRTDRKLGLHAVSAYR